MTITKYYINNKIYFIIIKYYGNGIFTYLGKPFKASLSVCRIYCILCQTMPDLQIKVPIVITRIVCTYNNRLGWVKSILEK